MILGRGASLARARDFSKPSIFGFSTVLAVNMVVAAESGVEKQLWPPEPELFTRPCMV